MSRLTHVEATLLKRGKPVRTRNNCLKTHPFLTKYTEYPYLHAESNVVLSYGVDNCKGLDIYVTRTLKDGSVTMAKPCKVCMRILKDVGIRKIYYTNWKGKVECLKLT